MKAPDPAVSCAAASLSPRSASMLARARKWSAGEVSKNASLSRRATTRTRSASDEVMPGTLPNHEPCGSRTRRHDSGCRHARRSQHAAWPSRATARCCSSNSSSGAVSTPGYRELACRRLGELGRGSGQKVLVQRGAGDPGLGDDLADAVAGVAQVRGVGELVRVNHRQPADPAARGGGNRSGVRGPLEGVGALHLPEQRQQSHRQLRHRVGGVGQVDPNRIWSGPTAAARAARPTTRDVRRRDHVLDEAAGGRCAGRAGDIAGPRLLGARERLHLQGRWSLSGRAWGACLPPVNPVGQDLRGGVLVQAPVLVVGHARAVTAAACWRRFTAGTSSNCTTRRSDTAGCSCAGASASGAARSQRARCGPSPRATRSPRRGPG